MSGPARALADAVGADCRHRGIEPRMCYACAATVAEQFADVQTAHIARLHRELLLDHHALVTEQGVNWQTHLASPLCEVCKLLADPTAVSPPEPLMERYVVYCEGCGMFGTPIPPDTTCGNCQSPRTRVYVERAR